MVECMIENESARQLWKKYFLQPKQVGVELDFFFYIYLFVGIN